MKKVAVIIWLYHNDLSTEFVSLLNNTSDIFDIYLCLCENNDNTKALYYFQTLSNLKSIKFYPNIGADIYSFIDQICHIHPREYDYFIKIHSKKSTWGPKNICNWRAILLHSLISDRQNIQQNIRYMNKYNLGATGCGPLIYDNNELVHADKIYEFEKIFNMSFDTRRFVGGNMFMGRINLFQNYITAYQKQLLKLISKEKNKVSEAYGGTYCHAFERILGYIGSTQGLKPSIESTIRIITPSNEIPAKRLNFVLLYNQDIYCVQNPSIYGHVKDISDDHIEVVWNNLGSPTLRQYFKINKNTYIWH